MAAMTDESIRVTRSVDLPLREIEYRTSRSSGPGGQHAQKTESRVDAILDLAATTALTETQRRRAIGKAGPVIRAVAQDDRSQHRNRELATARLVEGLRAALKIERPRRATKPTAASKERRLEGKRRQGEKKRLRQPPT
jgi:ribosome-associated protein